VKGIQGDVDINVFNGYEDQWQEFLNQQLIP
jgi:GH25 family lysozyme M1 (1,4-beta-N-acetylmuramidase)